MQKSPKKGIHNLTSQKTARDNFPRKRWTVKSIRATSPASPSHPSSVALCLWSVPLFRRRRQILRWHGLWCGSWHPEQAAWRLWLGGGDEALSHQLQSEHEHSAGAGDGPLQQPALHHPRLMCQHSEGHKGTQEEPVEKRLDVKKKKSLQNHVSRMTSCLVLNLILVHSQGSLLFCILIVWHMARCTVITLNLFVLDKQWGQMMNHHWFYISMQRKQYFMRGGTPLLNDYRGNSGNTSSEIRYCKHSAQHSKCTNLTPSVSVTRKNRLDSNCESLGQFVEINQHTGELLPPENLWTA